MMPRYVKLRPAFCAKCRKKTIHERGGSVGAGYWWTCTVCKRVKVKT